MLKLEAVEGVRKYTAQVDEISEANVCNFIVTPLLLAIGYRPEDISIQSHQKNSGKYPDYTILGNRVRDQDNISFPWFIEVKAQGSPLTSQDATQACNYAHSNGRRWTVLTNGLEWHLYDVNLNNVEPSDKVILKMGIAQEEFIDLLDILSYQSVSENLVENKIRLQTLKSEIRTSLRNPSSGIIRSIKYGLQHAEGLSCFTEQDIVRVMNSLLINNSQIIMNVNISDSTKSESTQADIPQYVTTQKPSDMQIIANPYLSQFPKGSIICPLSTTGNVTGMKPIFLVIGNEYRVKVTEWKQILKELLIWICENKKRPLDLGKYLLISPKTMKGYALKFPFNYRWDDKEVYIDTNKSAITIIKAMKDLCEIVGMKQDDITIGITSKQ